MANTNPKTTFLELIDLADNVPYDFDYGNLYRLLLPEDDRSHGFMLPSTVSRMPWTDNFNVNHGLKTVRLNDSSNGSDTTNACNNAFEETIKKAIDKNLFPQIKPTHTEMYKILGANKFTCLLRSSSSLFGIASRGSHLTAYVRTPNDIKVWVARRSAKMHTYPNMLDTTVGGGVKAEHSPLECMLQEADEEASLSRSFVADNMQSTGVITYVTENKQEGTIHPDILYVFDIELPETVTPVPKDTEVAEFNLMTVEEVKDAMFREEFKPNCVLVMIDFFIRHGITTSENEKDYVEIASRLRRRIPFPIMPISASVSA